MTYIEILDTAVKIGLGAIISAASAYLLSKQNHSQERKNRFDTRRLDTLEKTASHFDDYLNSLSDLVSAIDGVRKTIPTVKSFDFESESHRKHFLFIRENDDKFCTDRRHRAYAASKLRLLGFKDSAAILKGCSDLENDIRELVIFGTSLPDSDQVTAWRDRAAEIRDQLYENLQSHYRA